MKNKKTNGIYIKRIVPLLMVLVFIPNLLNAQLSNLIMNSTDTLSLFEIKSEMEIYLDSLNLVQDSAILYSEGGEYTEYMNFLDYWESRVFPQGDFSKVFDTDSIYYALTENTYDYYSDQPWHELGPFNKPDGGSTFTEEGIGPVEYLSIFDDGTNESTRYMLVSSILGGVFYSTDYGENWSSTESDSQTGLTGINCAIFNPTNHTEWFASTTGNSNAGWVGKTGGIYRTSDEGVTWTKIAAHTDIGGSWTKIYKLLIVQSNPDALFAVTSNGIYKSADFYSPNSSPSWTKVNNGLSYDLEVKPDDNNKLYAATFSEGVWKVINSVDAGNTWLDFTTQPQLVEDSDTRGNSFTLEVSKAKPDYLYCLVNQPNSNTNVYYSVIDGSNSWNKVNTQSIYMPFGSGHAFGVDQVNNGNTIFVSYSTDTKKFDINVPGSGTKKYQYHDDVEDIVYHPYNSGEIWLCTHGGMEKSINGGDSFETKYSGIAVANVEEMATSITNPETILTGLFHDGTILTMTPYSHNWRPDWNVIKWGDGQRPLISPIDQNVMWASSQEGSWSYSEDRFVSSTYKFLSSQFNTEGTLNKINPTILYRHGFISSTDERAEIYITDASGNHRISSFNQLYPNGYAIINLFSPYTNGNHLLVMRIKG